MKKFKEYNIAPEAMTVLQHSGIKEMTPVQEAAIPAVRSGNDCIVQAPTGTGKTLAFLLPVMEKLKPGVLATQALIVTPTRELTIQIAKVAQDLSAAYDIKTLAIYGGQDIDRQKERLGRHPQLVIGTPGRLLDHLRRHTLDLTTANKIVLDEADEMMKLGFIEDVETLLTALASDHLLMLFSATIPDRIRALAHRFMKEPREVTIEAEHITLDTIHQVIVDVAEEKKMEKLCELVNEKQPYLAMIFCQTKQRVHNITMELARHGFLVDELHGDLTQAQRTLVLKRFRTAELQLLVTTDIAARGLDIEGVTHVFNYDLPRNTTDYIHRIGRTGRAGHDGEAITFVEARQYEQLRRIEAGLKNRIDKQRAVHDRQKTERHDQKRAKQLQEQHKNAKPLSKYANRKGAEHKGTNPRSRRNPAGRTAAKPTADRRTRSGRR